MGYSGPMRRWLMLTVVLCATLVAPFGAAPAHAQAATASEASPPPATTTLQASASPSVYTYGRISQLAINGNVSVPGAELTLLRADEEASWVEVARTTAGTDGGFVFGGVPAPPATTEYEVAYAGSEGQEPASVPVLVLVRPRLTLSAPTTAWIAPGASVRLSGTVAPAHIGGDIVIDRRKADGSWVQVADTTLRSDSTFSLAWTPTVADKFSFGTYTLRARMAADADHRAGWSPSRKVTVNRQNAHKVPYKYKHYLVNVVHEYRLYYYERGRMVRSFRVALGRPGYPTPIGTYSIYYKRRPGGGALGSCVMFYRRAGGIAIHGTNQPHLLSRFPRPFSHGCTRMYNKDALWLYYRCGVGTPVKNLR